MDLTGEIVFMRNRICAAALAAAVSICMVFSAGAAQGYEQPAVSFLPDVTAEMTSPDYWLKDDPQADAVLADYRQIQALNQAMVQEPACNMFDLRNYSASVSAGLPSRLYASAQKDFAEYTEPGYYDGNGAPVSQEHMDRITANCLNPDYEREHGAAFAVAVKRTDLRAFPTDEIVTDERGDIDFDYMQNSSLRVNEPVILLSLSADGRWWNALSASCGGWVPAEDVAICRDRQEWLSAWDLGGYRTLVVTDPRVYLNMSQTSSAVSELLLTQGTVLELAPYDVSERITNRAPQQNYAVYVPVRGADGSYQKVKALIPQHAGVSVGYLPLTKRNILRTAFRALGETYGWGGMLKADDCSGYIRGVYRCFGLELPRNTTWQAAAPAEKYDLSGLDDGQKTELIAGLPAGTTLFFRGHEMMYLGTEGGKVYVVSSASSLLNPFAPGRFRLRSVAINTMDLKRANGTTWLSNLYEALVPWSPQR